MTDFSKMVIRLVGQIPPGRVSTYKQIATLAGKPQGSRGVAWILNSSSNRYKLPWHRVLGSSGRLSFPADSPSFRLQKKRLSQEGVAFSKAGTVDLKQFQWNKKVKRPVTKGPQIFRS